MGIKPITISETSIYNYNKKLVLKPNNLLEYEKMLLTDNHKNFKILEKYKIVAKKIIYFNEKIMSLRKDLNSVFIFRTEKHRKHIDYKKVNRNLKKNIVF